MYQCFNAEKFCEWSDTNENKPISVDQGDLFDLYQLSKLLNNKIQDSCQEWLQ